VACQDDDLWTVVGCNQQEFILQIEHFRKIYFLTAALFPAFGEGGEIPIITKRSPVIVKEKKIQCMNLS
jgi:hypothetical protein